MTGKIIGKRVVPNVFEFYEKDAGSCSVKFIVEKQNDGVNFEHLKGFANIEYESGRIDRVMLNKSVDGSNCVYELVVTGALTSEEGKHRIQLSFENEELGIVYKTCIFTFAVCESIDSNLAYENIAPSIVNELEEKMVETLSECNSIKEETASVANQIANDKSEVDYLKNECYYYYNESCTNKDEAYNYKEEANKIFEDTKEFYNKVINGSYVTSINNKKGDVILTASDIEGLENIGVGGNKEYQVVSEEECNLHIKNGSSIFISYAKKINLYSDLLDGEKGANAEIYWKISEVIPQIYASPNFYFHGDNCEGAVFKPYEGNYYMRVYKVEQSGKIYVEVKKLKYIYWNFSSVQGLPAVVNFEKGVDYINNVVINGSLATETVNGVETFCYPVRGVGEPVIDENGQTKYKIEIVTQNANALSISYLYDAVDSYTVSFNETSGLIEFYGTAYMEYETYGQLNSPIKKGSTVFFNAFNIASNINTQLTDGVLIEFTLCSDSSDVLKIGIDYAGNPCLIDGYSNSAYLEEDITYIKVKHLERAMGTEFNNSVGLTVSVGAPMQEFQKSLFSKAEVYLDKPLLKLGTNVEKLNLREGTLSNNIKIKTINSKSELEPLSDSVDAPAVKKFGAEFPSIPYYNVQLWIHGKSYQDSISSVKVNSNKNLEFKKEVFGTYQNFDESVFPMHLIYYCPSVNLKIPLRPFIKVFEGNTTVDIVGGEKPSGGSVGYPKKSG